MSDDDFISELEMAFESRLGKLELNSQRAAFPLSLMHVEHTIAHRIALIGDAAHRVHPLAGQGLNLGLADVAALAEVLTSNGADVGAWKVLPIRTLAQRRHPPDGQAHGPVQANLRNTATGDTRFA